METQVSGYSVAEVIEVLEMLSRSQGFYERLLEEVEYIRDNDYEKFDAFTRIVEEQKFKDPVDVVLFFEQ